MATVVATHSGPFHADDVVAFALIRTFHDADADVVRTRDPARIDAADLVIDVGGVHDPEHGRFDHHQATYTGPRSAAGMVLDWLEATDAVSATLAERLRTGAMTYLDDVDNGRVAPDHTVPCFPRIVDALNQPASTEPEFDRAYLKAAAFAEAWLQGVAAEHARIAVSHRVVLAAMADAASAGRRVLFLDAYMPWKPIYFSNGGETHPSDYVLFPGTDGSWRVVAIPPRQGEFGQKRSLPEAWAGLTDADLEAVTGVAGSIFCHKNRFIAVFATREAAIEALEGHGLMS